MSAMRGTPPDASTLALQQAALRRVREMQSRAARTVQETNSRQAILNAAAVASDPNAVFTPEQGGAAVPNTAPAPSGNRMPPVGSPAQRGSGNPRTAVHPGPAPPRAGAPPFMPGAAGNPPAAARPGPRPGGFGQGAPSILSQLFGGGARRTDASRQSNFSRTAFGADNSRPSERSGRPAGLLDLLRSRGVSDSLGGLGETLHSTISSVSEPISGLLDSLGVDGETLIILLVMWVIFNERSDKTLLLALGYLLL